MWKDLLMKLMLMPVLRDALNFVLRYLLAQPVEIDIVVAFGALLEFTGIPQLLLTLQENQDEELAISLQQLEPINKHQEF
jgi:hypothetical protein